MRFRVRLTSLLQRLTAAALVVFGLLALASPAAADSAIVTKSGTLYEVFPALYGNVVPGSANSSDARTPVLALRTTLPGRPATLEIVQGTLDQNEKADASIDFDETTGTVFIVYSKYSGLMSQVHVAVRRNDRWVERDILPSLGLYLSLNPQIVVTRQRFVDFDGQGGTVPKWRSILHVVWWEESGDSQARYAVVFVEDGILKLDAVTAYNLNQLANAMGATPALGLAFSSYQFPAVQRDPTTNGGVLVSFVDLADRQEHVLGLTYPDDITQLVPIGATIGSTEAYARAHRPIGRSLSACGIPLVETQSRVGTVISPGGLATFYWIANDRVYFRRSDAPAGSATMTIPLRTDLTVDRALALVREMALKD